jgi:hypothetical protein
MNFFHVHQITIKKLDLLCVIFVFLVTEQTNRGIIQSRILVFRFLFLPYFLFAKILQIIFMFLRVQMLIIGFIIAKNFFTVLTINPFFANHLNPTLLQDFILLFLELFQRGRREPSQFTFYVVTVEF